MLITVYDKIKNFEYEEEKYFLIDYIQYKNRQVNLYFNELQHDDYDQFTWNMENWCCIDGRRFIRTFSKDGHFEREFSGYDIYDMDKYFLPEKADRVEIA